MQTLELINERFARQMRHVLLNFMRRSADITVGSIKIQKYADFERNLPVPSNLNMIQMKPLRGTALFTYDPNLVFRSSTACSAAMAATTRASRAVTSPPPNSASSSACST